MTLKGKKNHYNVKLFRSHIEDYANVNITEKNGLGTIYQQSLNMITVQSLTRENSTPFNHCNLDDTNRN